MTQRLFFLVSDEKAAHELVQGFRGMSIADADIHAVARDDKRLHDIPRADQRQTSDVMRARKLGLLVGALAGLVLGLVLVYALNISVGGIAPMTLLALTTVSGAVLGLFSSFLVGVSMKNDQLEPFQQDIQAGRVLVLVDVANDRAEAVQNVVYSHHRDAVIKSGELD